jgi:hypothetical protein
MEGFERFGSGKVKEGVGGGCVCRCGLLPSRLGGASYLPMLYVKLVLLSRCRIPLGEILKHIALYVGGGRVVTIAMSALPCKRCSLSCLVACFFGAVGGRRITVMRFFEFCASCVTNRNLDVHGVCRTIVAASALRTALPVCRKALHTGTARVKTEPVDLSMEYPRES